MKLLKLKQNHPDYAILLTVAALCAFGLVMVFSASYYYAQNTAGLGYDGYYYLRKQGLFVAVGIPMMIFISFIDYRKLEKLKVVGLLASIGLLVLVLIVGEETNGAKRWIVIGGQSIQPS